MNTINKQHESKGHNSCINPSIIKSVFKSFVHRANTVYSEKYIKEKTQFLIDRFVENEHKRTFPENLVKILMAKTKTIRVAITPTQIKLCGYLIILDQKLDKNLKR